MDRTDRPSDDAAAGGVRSPAKDGSSSGMTPSPFQKDKSNPSAGSGGGDDATLLPASTPPAPGSSGLDDATYVGASDTTSGHGGGASSGINRARVQANAAAILEVGTVLGGRYEIQDILGIGGMGAVYKAHDRDIDRTIAVKVIRPDLAGHPEVVARFRQEMLLAREISHKNVVRIFDFRESGGVKFITMEYVVGRDLRALLAERDKLPPAEALAIIRHVCLALAAAHAEGVIHRDLKPSNIMIDPQGRVVVMDFGLARTVTGDGMSQTGAMLGTMEYMSPEQARAEKLDERSDLYTVGLILYELLTGKTPFRAESAIASLLKRNQENAVPVSEIDPEIPRSLSVIVSKCLERDPKDRYADMNALIEEIDILEGKRPASVFAQPVAPVVVRKRWMSLPVMIGGVVLLLALIGGGVWLTRSRVAPQAHKTVTVLLADFTNSTADPVFDGTLESGFGLAIEGAPFISAYNRGQAHKTVAQVKPGATALDEANAKLVAIREGISVVISGAVEKQGEGYKITCKAIDALTGKEIGSATTEASNKSDVLKAVGTLAGKMRGILGDTTPDSTKLAQAETYTSSSIEAAHEYAVAQDLRAAGKGDAAIESFLKAIQLDPKFGSAYAGLAAMYANQGHRAEATKYYNLAMQHVDRMTDREKYRTRGGFYLATMDPKKAIDEFNSLVQQYPADTMGRNSLAYAYYLNHDMARAQEEGRRALEIYPKNVPYRNNVALYAIYAGDFATAEKEARAALELNPAYLKAYIAVALSQLAQAHPEQAVETYHKMEPVSALGASWGANGSADLALYQSDAAQAITILNKGIAEDIAQKNTTAAAKKYTMLAEAQLMSGQTAQAVASLDKAVAMSKDAVLFPAARIYVEAGQDKKAADLAAELGKQLEPVPQAYAKVIAGDLQLKHGHAREAISEFQASEGIADTWLAHFDLARAYVAAGTFPQADSELSTCLKRRGEATDVYWDEMQTFHYFPAVYYYMGRTSEGLKSSGAAEAYKNFLALKAKETPDPMVADARKRAP